MKTQGMVLFYLHWNEDELKQRIATLKELNLAIRSHWNTETTAKFGTELPDILVISLDRLPSHGRQYAEWFWEAKKRQHIPIIFVDGQPDKVKATKEKFPKAIYCRSEALADTIKRFVTIKA